MGFVAEVEDFLPAAPANPAGAMGGLLQDLTAHEHDARAFSHREYLSGPPGPSQILPPIRRTRDGTRFLGAASDSGLILVPRAACVR